MPQCCDNIVWMLCDDPGVSAFVYSVCNFGDKENIVLCNSWNLHAKYILWGILSIVHEHCSLLWYSCLTSLTMELACASCTSIRRTTISMRWPTLTSCQRWRPGQSSKAHGATTHTFLLVSHRYQLSPNLFQVLFLFNTQRIECHGTFTQVFWSVFPRKNIISRIPLKICGFATCWQPFAKTPLINTHSWCGGIFEGYTSASKIQSEWKYWSTVEMCFFAS